MQAEARQVRSTLTKKLAIAAGACFGLFAVACGLIAAAGMEDHGTTADIIVVPGNTVLADGTPSERLKARLDVALALYREKRAPVIFVSGGVGREGRDEAEAMAAYLMSNGVPPQAIVRDSAGATTAATAENAAKYLRANQRQSALVATQYFHVARTRLALERNGVHVAGTMHARYFELRDAYSLPREVLAYAFYYMTLGSPAGN